MLVFKKHYFWRRITSLMFLLTSLGIRHWIQTLLDGMSSCGVVLDDNLIECHEYSADDSSKVQRSQTLIQETSIIKNGFRVIFKKTCSQHAIFSGFYKNFTDVCFRSIYRFYLLHPRIQIWQNLMKTVKYCMLQTKYSLRINWKLFRNIP